MIQSFSLNDICFVLANLYSQGFDRAVEQSLDAIRAKVNWLKRDRQDVEEWLSSNSYLQSKL